MVSIKIYEEYKQLKMKFSAKKFSPAGLKNICKYTTEKKLLLQIFTTKRKFEIKGSTKQAIKIYSAYDYKKYALLKTPTQVTGKKQTSQDTNSCLLQKK